jgi:putative flippase GtrA
MIMLSRLTRTVQAGVGSSAGRYLVVVVGGFAVDFAIAWLTHELLGFDLLVSATCGFVLAMLLSYFAHEFWTFRRPGSAVSMARFFRFVGACGATLATRLLLVWSTGLLPDLSEATLPRLASASGGSLVVGFLLNKKAVFRDPDENTLSG